MTPPRRIPYALLLATLVVGCALFSATPLRTTRCGYESSVVGHVAISTEPGEVAKPAHADDGDASADAPPPADSVDASAAWGGDAPPSNPGTATPPAE